MAGMQFLCEGCQLPAKKKPDVNKVAKKLAKLALRHLKVFSEEEQERRIAAAERRIAAASRD
jgi:hypothetical protein